MLTKPPLLPTFKAPAIRKYSQPPYLLTFKENGCIIFVSALTPTSLIVTSKHSLGAKQAPASATASAPAEEQEADDDDVAGEKTAPATAAAEAGSEPVSHAAKGGEWLDRHLSSVGRTRAELAGELWRRNETAAFELCDDSFEEHVLAYEAARSGLHLHGLNANAPAFRTRHMREVEAFAREWGFHPTRWIEMQSYDEVERLTREIAKSGMWHGEPLEGFVVRTRIPDDAPSVEEVLRQQREGEEGGSSSNGTVAAESAASLLKQGKAPTAKVARPPYEPGQTWFFKVKFDEPYLMYRDWRELARKMLGEQNKWAKEHGDAALQAVLSGSAAEDSASQSGNAETTPKAAAIAAANELGADSEDKSKNQKKREAKAAYMAAREAAEASARKRAGFDTIPAKPAPRSKRAETMAFIDWCYDRIWGSADGRVPAEPRLFEQFSVGKGIIHVRDCFLDYCQTPEGRASLAQHGKQSHVEQSRQTQAQEPAEATRAFTKTLIVPIAVPGCGKTALSVALRHAYPQIGHTQSDDVKAKKTAAMFLKNIEHELQHHDVVIADRNNHLFKHRDEIVAMVRRLEEKGFPPDKPTGGKKGAQAAKKGEAQEDAAKEPPPRIRVVAVAFALDALSLNQVFKVCAKRIVHRGDNHQALRADTKQKSHETILWRFLKDINPYGSAQRGEGTDGFGDERFDAVLRPEVDASLEQNFVTVLQGLRDLLGDALPPLNEEQVNAALDAARGYKVTIKKDMTPPPGHKAATKPRYYGLAIDVDLSKVVRDALSKLGDADGQKKAEASAFLAKLEQDERVVQHPHITLVHQTNVKAEESGQLSADETSAKSRWSRYEALVQQGEPVSFTFHFDKLVWDGRVMAFSVKDVHSEQLQDFRELQGGEGGQGQGSWRPHITIGTASDEIRPFEAHRALREAEAGKESISMLQLARLDLPGKGELQGLVA